MTQGKNMKKDLSRLAEVLDTFGADPARWPAPERVELEALAGTRGPARRLFDEARALERAMNAYPAVSASDELKARIVTAVAKNSERTATAAPVTVAPGLSGLSPRTRRAAFMWPVAALAASFAFGLYLGASGVGGQTFEGAFRIAAVDGAGGDAEDISWLEDIAGSDAEELL